MKQQFRRWKGVILAIILLGVVGFGAWYCWANSLGRIRYALGIRIPAGASRPICASNRWQFWESKDRYFFAMFDLPRDSVEGFVSQFEIKHDALSDSEGAKFIVDAEESEAYGWTVGDSVEVVRSYLMEPIAGSEQTRVEVNLYDGRYIVEMRVKWNID